MMAVVEGVHVKLWIKSNRGTDSHEIVVLPKSLVSDKRAMNAYLESWCEKFGAWNHGDNVVRYGCTPISKATAKKYAKAAAELKLRARMFKYKKAVDEVAKVFLKLQTLRQELLHEGTTPDMKGFREGVEVCILAQMLDVGNKAMNPTFIEVTGRCG